MNMNKMSYAEFDRREQEIDRGSPTAKEQSIANLYVESGWTQQEIADHTDMSQGWVSRQLTFGRFLKFMPIGHNFRELSERRFRAWMMQTNQDDSDEAGRFRAVAAALGFALPVELAPVANLDATIAEIAAAIGVPSSAARHSAARHSEIKTVVERGEPNVIAMLRSGQAGLTSTSYYVRCTPRDAQAKATVADVKRTYNEYRKKQSERRAHQGETVSEAPAVSTDGNGRNGKRPTVWMPPKELMTRPKPVDLTKIEGVDNESDRTVRVHLWATRVRDLMQDLENVGMSESRVSALALQIDTDTVFSPAIERLLAYRPKPGKTNGEQRDFAAEARKAMRRILADADQAEANLHAIRETARRFLEAETKVAPPEGSMALQN